MKIFASIDDAPPQWLDVRLRINMPMIGNEVRVKSLAPWTEPVDWLKVRVSKITRLDDGQVTYSLSRQDNA